MGSCISCNDNNLISDNINLEVRKLDKNHPAYPGYGVFAIQEINCNSHIGEYVGKVTDKQGRNPRSKYLLRFNDETFIDGGKGGNFTKYINDYTNITNKSNCRYCKSGFKCIIKSESKIFPNEEITVDYGEGYRKKWKIIPMQ
jgi:SET domain-containing protein